MVSQPVPARNVALMTHRIKVKGQRLLYRLSRGNGIVYLSSHKTEIWFFERALLRLPFSSWDFIPPARPCQTPGEHCWQAGSVSWQRMDGPTNHAWGKADRWHRLAPHLRNLCMHSIIPGFGIMKHACCGKSRCRAETCRGSAPDPRHA